MMVMIEGRRRRVKICCPHSRMYMAMTQLIVWRARIALSLALSLQRMARSFICSCSFISIMLGIINNESVKVMSNMS